MPTETIEIPMDKRYKEVYNEINKWGEVYYNAGPLANSNLLMAGFCHSRMELLFEVLGLDKALLEEPYTSYVLKLTKEYKMNVLIQRKENIPYMLYSSYDQEDLWGGEPEED